ncbi:bestrophin-4 [Drosophila busckii]|uniref:bestrophin-4 n=1 Tax=Drosophila busckii TaxID=30019 RepID=UPI001432D45B|nr:bestrophin-4 [Drosophila busckii]
MTVTYTANVATSGVISKFLLLLFRWRASIYKLVWCDLLVFIGLYILLALTYRLIMNEPTRNMFESLVIYFLAHGSLIPLAFVLGFFVSIVMDRWWKQYTTIPMPDSIAILVSSCIHGFDDRARVMRRTILRYVVLCQVIVFTMISPSVKKRFPNYDHIIETGLLQECEKKIMEDLDLAFPHYPKHWMPIVWAASIVMRARRENKIRDDYAVKSIIDELNKFRGLCGFLLYYDWVSVPLVYTQVVTLATYTYFLCSVIGQQWIDVPETGTRDNVVVRFFPILTVLQFFFYMGWLKVAESLINPFGDDDDDFELNWMIDRNLTVAYLIVDEMHQEHPELVKDQYWDEVLPSELPNYDTQRRYVVPEASTARLILQKSVPSGEHLRSFLGGRQRFYRESTSSFLSHTSSRKIGKKFTDMEKRPTFSPHHDSEDTLDARTSPASLNFEELIEQRNRERRERLRNRFLNMRSNQRPPNSGRYTVTVLRPPSLRSSQHFFHEFEEYEEEETVAETEQEQEQEHEAPNNKPEKYE